MDQTNSSPTEDRLSSLATLNREQAEAHLVGIRERRHASVERHKEALAVKAAIVEAKERAKADRLLDKITKQIHKTKTEVDKLEAMLNAFDVGNWSMRKTKK